MPLSHDGGDDKGRTRHPSDFLFREANRVVDPDVDRPEATLDRLGRRLHLTRVGHIRRQHDRPAAGRFHLALGRFQARAPPREQADLCALRREAKRCRTADAR
jgi:hypothetical protein